MQTTTDFSSLSIAMGGGAGASSRSARFNRMLCAAKRKDRETLTARIDRQISRAGAIVLALSALYFAPIILSILSR